MNNQSPKQSSDRQYYMFALRIVGDFGITIAVPAVLGTLLGQWLEDKYGHAPFFTVFCLIIAFLITIRIIQKKAKKYGDQYEKM